MGASSSVQSDLPGSTQKEAVQAAVQRVLKEGGKYGLGTMVVSKRLSEAGTTIYSFLSHCGTTIALRLSNANDQNHVISAAADNRLFANEVGVEVVGVRG